MGLISQTKDWVDNEVLTYTDLNSMFDTLYTLVNGNIDNDNVDATAGIDEAKIAISDPGSGYTHTGTYATLDDHISDATAHGGGLAQFERHFYGVVATGTNVLPRWYNKSGQTKTIDKVFLYAETAPTGADLIADINLNGTTIFTTQANRPTVTAGANTATSGTPDTTSVADGDYITFDIDQVGSTVPGADILFVIYFT